MKKHNLKIVEPGAEGALETAIAVAAEANEKLRAAEASFAKKFPGDHRLVDIKAHWDPERVAFYEDQRAVFDLRREAESAGRAVDQARARGVAAVTETERRAALADAIATAAKTGQSVENIRAAVDRAKMALTAAETRLSEASIAEETARKANAGRVLDAIEADRAIGTNVSLRHARDSKIEAADEVSFARDAVTAVETKLRNAEEALRGAHDQITLCAKDVVTSAIPKLLQATMTMHAELEARRQVLRLLGQWDGAAGDEAIDGYTSSVPFPFEQAGENPEDHPAAASWLAAIGALVRDADAPLPTI